MMIYYRNCKSQSAYIHNQIETITNIYIYVSCDPDFTGRLPSISYRPHLVLSEKSFVLFTLHSFSPGFPSAGRTEALQPPCYSEMRLLTVYYDGNEKVFNVVSHCCHMKGLFIVHLCEVEVNWGCITVPIKDTD